MKKKKTCLAALLFLCLLFVMPGGKASGREAEDHCRKSDLSDQHKGNGKSDSRLCHEGQSGRKNL